MGVHGAMAAGTRARRPRCTRWGWPCLACGCACVPATPTGEPTPRPTDEKPALETPSDPDLVDGHDSRHEGGIVETHVEESGSPGAAEKANETGPVVPIALRDGGPLECPQQFGKDWRYLISCGDRCVEPLTDIDNCGGCGLSCAAVAPSAPACVGGRCLLPSSAEPSSLVSKPTPGASRRPTAVVRESRMVRVDGVDEHWWLALLRHISLSIRCEMDLIAKGENSDGLGEASG
jgi:hypothetical protein